MRIKQTSLLADRQLWFLGCSVLDGKQCPSQTSDGMNVILNVYRSYWFAGEHSELLMTQQRDIHVILLSSDSVFFSDHAEWIKIWLVSPC